MGLNRLRRTHSKKISNRFRGVAVKKTNGFSLADHERTGHTGPKWASRLGGTSGLSGEKKTDPNLPAVDRAGKPGLSFYPVFPEAGLQSIRPHQGCGA